MKNSKYLVALVVVLLALGSVAYAQSDQPKVGNKGHLTLKQETRVGDAVLPAGDYVVRHRRTASGHFVEFKQGVYHFDNDQGEGGLLPPYESKVVAKVPCDMQSLSEPVAKTTAEISKDTGANLDNLRIRGETVVHVFPGQNESGGGGM